jgi:hypothetical protein
MATRYKELPIEINYDDQSLSKQYSSTPINTKSAAISDAGLDFMLGKELYRGHRHWDGEKYVKGYGYSGGAFSNGITETNAYRLWITDVTKAQNALRKRLNNSPEFVLQHQWDALVSMFFDTGSIDYTTTEGYEFDLIYFIQKGTIDQVSSAIQIDNRKPTRRVAEASLFRLCNYGNMKPRSWLRNEGIQHIRKNYLRLEDKDGNIDKTAQHQAQYSYYKETSKFIKDISEIDRRRVISLIKQDSDTSIDSSTPIEQYVVKTTPESEYKKLSTAIQTVTTTEAPFTSLPITYTQSSSGSTTGGGGGTGTSGTGGGTSTHSHIVAQWLPPGGGSGQFLNNLGSWSTPVGSGDNSFNGVFANLTEVPTTIAGYGILDAFQGNFNDLTNVPNLFSGSYNDLTDKPSNFGGASSSVAGTYGFVPSPLVGDQLKYLSASGVWAVPPNTTYANSDWDHNQLTNWSADQHIDWTQDQSGIPKEIHVNNYAGGSLFGGATSSTDGTQGLVPAPVAGDELKFLKGDRTWAVVSSYDQSLNTTDDVTFDDLIINGNLTVNGTETIVNTSKLEVEDHTIEIGKVTTPTDITADGGGIILKAASDKTITWDKTTDMWGFNIPIHLTTELGSNPTVPADGAGGYFYTKADGKPYWMSYEKQGIDLSAGTVSDLTDTTISTPANGEVLAWDGTNNVWINQAGAAGDLSGLADTTIATPSSGQVLTWNGTTWVNQSSAGGGSGALGTPTDATYNDGAYYHKNSSYSSGTLLSGIDTAGTISDAIDGINETVRNIQNNTYVQGSTFTNTPLEGGASPSAPLSVRFTIADPGNATHADWAFEDVTTPANTVNITNSTSTLSNGYYDQSFTSVAGGNINVTMTLKCQTASGTTGLTEGSYSIYKKDAAVELWTPDPEVAWATTSNDQVVDLGSSTPADREIEFDTTASLYTHYWMIEFGDGTKYPSGASTSGDNTHVQSNWINWTTTKTHTYDYDANGSTVTADTQWSPKVWCRSTTAQGGAGATASLEKANHIKGYITPIATFAVNNLTTGNNDEIGDTNAQGSTNTAEGHPVRFTNSSANLGTWGDTTYTWDWGDLTSDTVVTGGDNVDGDYLNDIEHYFTLADDLIAETFDVTLKAQNLRTTSNWSITSTSTITVNVDPRAGFSGVFTNLNTSANGSQSYVNDRVGFDFTKYNPTSGGADSNGASNIVQFTGSSTGLTDASTTLNASYAWDFGDSNTSVVISPSNTYINTSSPLQRTVKLITTTDNSYTGGTDDTENKVDYIEIRKAPATPAGLTGYTIAVPTSVGLSPLICADTDDNTAGTSAPTGGTSVNRQITNSMTSDELSDWANEFPSNGTYSGTLKAHVNESVDGSPEGMVTFTGADKINRWDSAGNISGSGLLEVTQERDANADVATTYPDNFFKEFKAKVYTIGITPGYNTVQLKHEDTSVSTKSTWVYDDKITVPSVSSWGTSTPATSSYRYMSGVAFYKTGATISIVGQAVLNLTGQTYRDTTAPVTISNEVGTAITSQTYTYTDILPGAVITGSIPKKNIATVTLNGLTVNINGSGQGKDGKIKTSVANVNGTSVDIVDATEIMYWFATPTLDEAALPNNITVGSAVTNAPDLIRIKYAWTGTDYAYPTYSDTTNNYYTTHAWDSQNDTLSGTDEAGCYLNEIKHTLEDFSSSYLPVGADLGAGSRSVSSTQYFTMCFQRNSMAKFSIKITGEVTSLYIAFPGYDTDNTSGLNGWLDCSTLYGGAEFPGSDTGAGGNGSDGVRRQGTAADQGAFAINTALTNAYANLDLGTANTGLATEKHVLVRFGIADGKSVTAISVEDWS